MVTLLVELIVTYVVIDSNPVASVINTMGSRLVQSISTFVVIDCNPVASVINTIGAPLIWRRVFVIVFVTRRFIMVSVINYMMTPARRTGDIHVRAAGEIQ